MPPVPEENRRNSGGKINYYFTAAVTLMAHYNRDWDGFEQVRDELISTIAGTMVWARGAEIPEECLEEENPPPRPVHELALSVVQQGPMGFGVRRKSIIQAHRLSGYG